MLRTSALALLFAVLAAPLVHAQQTQNDPALAAQLRSLITPFHGKVSVYAHDMATGQTVAIDADEVVPTASVIKLTILYTALEQMRAGKLHFSDPLTLTHQDQVPGSGVLLFFDTPLRLDVHDALTLMINESDNTATNLMIDRLGLKTIDDQIVALGMKNTWLYKKVYRPAVGPMPADQPLYGLGKTTAREIGGLMQRFVTCSLGPAPALPPGASVPSDQDLCAAALHMLRLQMDRDGIPRYLESLDTTEGQSAIANKTGALDHVRNDVGAVYTPKGVIVLSIFTHDNQNTSWTADNPALLVIARIAKTVVDQWMPGS
jgi:beta-lactamase class A